MIETELKARVADPDAVLAALRDHSGEEPAVYSDTYFDFPDRRLAASDRELRIRTVTVEGFKRTHLTYKEPAVDETSRSKPEHETVIGDPAAARTALIGLGLEVDIEFEKRCSNFKLTHGGYAVLATVVQVPEIDGVFIEVETLVEQDELTPALASLRGLLDDIGIGEDELTTDTYTGAVRAARATARAEHLPC